MGSDGALYLVTGGAGFIGSNLVHALLRLGERVRVLGSFSVAHPEDLAGLERTGEWFSSQQAEATAAGPAAIER